MRLHHRLTLLEAKQGSEYVLNELQAESYQYTHIGSFPETLQGLNAAEKIVFHYGNLLHCQPDEHMEQQEIDHDPPVTFYHLLWKMNLWLKDVEGDLYRFQYYKNPRMYALSLWTQEQVETACNFLKSWRELCGGGCFILDQVWLQKKKWWSEQEIGNFYTLGHLAVIQAIYSSLLKTDEWVTFNGEWERIYPYPCMFENVDRFYPEHWDELLGMFERKDQEPGSIFSVAGSPESEKMREALDRLRDPSNLGIVEFTNPESEALARQEIYG